MRTTSRWIERALVLAATLLALGASAQVFKWTDAQGKVHYGDKPPDDAKRQELRVPSKSYDGPPQIQDWAAIIRRPTSVAGLQPNTAGIAMFSATWCGPCKRAKAYLKQKGVAYRDVDIEGSDANAAEFESYGGGGIPFFISGSKRMRGFSPEGLDQLAAAARR